MTTFTISGFYGNNNSSDIFVCEMNGGYWYAVEDSHNVNFTYDAEICEDGCNVETLTDSNGFTTKDPILSEEDLYNACNDEEEDEPEYQNVIDSFFNGQFSQMCEQFGELDAGDFIQELQDDESINDKQKISILGKLLRDNAI